MAPTSGHSSNHSTSSNGKPAAVAARHERTPATPRKDSSSGSGRERALQDPGLKDYRLGEPLGKGAFGAVFKAIHWGTGEAVAVKQIKLVNLPKSELRMIEHDNIVKYIGFVKSTDCLNIILEYVMEPCWLQNIRLHKTDTVKMGVIHRDIKGANILTTKDGKVKLADFGVSTSTLSGPDKEHQVVGTPYWMAPEIIELSGATPASDIWSLGCTVIELLQGKPPYHHLQAMPALFAIVNDDHPPLPEGVSSAARDFLIQCFQKDPNLRVSAKKLLKHNWIVGCRRSDAPVAKAPGNFSQAVEEVKQWNKALDSDSHSHLRASTGSNPAESLHPRQGSRYSVPEQTTRLTTPAKGILSLAKPRVTAEDYRSPEHDEDDNWDADFVTAISSTALQLPHIKPQDHFHGLLSTDRIKQFATSTSSREVSGNWDDLPEGEMVTIRKASIQEEDPQEKTIRPQWKMPPKLRKYSEPEPQPRRKSSSTPRRRPATSHQRPKSQGKGLGDKFELPSRPNALAFRENSIDDYSDIFGNDEHDQLVFNQRVGQMKKPDAPQLFHPSDLKSLPRSTYTPPGGSLRRQAASRPSVLPDRQLQRASSNIEIQRFAEDEDEDFSDVFGPTDKIVEKPESDRGSEPGGLMVLSKLSNNSWLGDEEDEDDPFASMDPGWDEMDLEANIARDRHARLAEKTEELVRSIKMIEGEDRLSELSEDLLALLWENEEVKDLIISAHGLLPILELLEPCTVKSRQHMILQLLKVVNTIILEDVELQENLCFVGGIPIITKFAARQYSNEIRLEAAAFVRQMYTTSTLTLQMFVSAGGLNVLVEFLDEDYDIARDLVLIGVNGIWNVFELQGPTPKNDFCRIFARNKILDPLALVLHRVLDEDDGDELKELVEGRIVNIFYLFSQAENYVKEMVADRQVLKSVLKDLRRMTPAHQITMLKFIKNLSMLSTTLDALHSADAIDALIDILGYSMKKGHPHFREICNQVLNTMFNLCRLNKDRQEDAAVNGIIPLLMKILKTDRPPKEFALPILCDMAHSGRKGRRFLWQNKGLDLYVSLLGDQYWQVTALDAIFVWLQEETAKVEDHLTNGNFTNAIVACFNTHKLNAFDPNVLEPLLKLLRLSPCLSSSLARPEMYSGIAQKLNHKKAVVRLNLLRLVRNILDARDSGYYDNPWDKQLRSLRETIQILADKDSAVLVRNLASELVRSHINGDAEGSVLPLQTTALSSSTGGSRPQSSGRRIYTPPSLHSSQGTPMTPTSSAHHRSSQAAYIEVAASPRRRTAVPQDLDTSGYRPRSRDGGGLPISALPRRVSTDQGVNPAGVGVKSRLPRNLAIPSYENGGESSSARSRSVQSNKENITGGRYTQHTPSGHSGQGHAREGSGGGKARRRPSETNARRWA